MRYPCLSMLLCIALLSSFALGGASGYHLGSTYKLGGDGGWDYLTIDSATRHFYVSRGTHVLVMDATRASRSAISRIRPAFTELRWRRSWDAVLPAMGAKGRLRFLTWHRSNQSRK